MRMTSNSVYRDKRKAPREGALRFHGEFSHLIIKLFNHSVVSAHPIRQGVGCGAFHGARLRFGSEAIG